MEITIFAKNCRSKDGRNFVKYVARLTKKDGTKIPAQVKIPEEKRPYPAECPMNIIIEKGKANLSEKHYVNESTGEMHTRYELWVSDYTKGKPYVDHSLDDFDD